MYGVAVNAAGRRRALKGQRVALKGMRVALKELRRALKGRRAARCSLDFQHEAQADFVATGIGWIVFATLQPQLVVVAGGGGQEGI